MYLLGLVNTHPNSSQQKNGRVYLMTTQSLLSTAKLPENEQSLRKLYNSLVHVPCVTVSLISAAGTRTTRHLHVCIVFFFPQLRPSSYCRQKEKPRLAESCVTGKFLMNNSFSLCFFREIIEKFQLRLLIFIEPHSYG